MTERTYTNYLAEIGISDEEAGRMVDDAFQTLFYDIDETICYRTDADAWCMVDTGNADARTEGMSYGMMMCVQMDRQDIFDKLWTFSCRYMLQTEGIYEGYFAWSVRLNGRHFAEGPAPDGEEYYAMALFMAGARWGDGEGIYNYTEKGREILRHCLHQKELVEGGDAMWEPENAYIRFTPEARHTDPSYHLPHFYELFAQKADECDRPFWKRAAEEARKYIIKTADPKTGLSPEYSEYDGTTRLSFRKSFAYYSDAYRVAENIALDHIWFGPHPEEDDILTRLQDFFGTQDMNDLRAYQLDGTAVEEPAMHPVAIKAVLGAASIGSKSANRTAFLKQFAETPLRKGKRRYYDNCLWFFCLLMLAGRYRIYI